jgi:hypothetical protein
MAIHQGLEISRVVPSSRSGRCARSSIARGMRVECAAANERALRFSRAYGLTEQPAWLSARTILFAATL